MDSEYSIRPARKGDEARIYALLEGKDSPLPLDDSRHPLNITHAIIAASKNPRSEDRCWLAVAGDRPIGIITTDGNFPGGVYVEEDHRGHGIATALILTREAFLVEQGQTETSLDVLASNTGAITCYRKLGYEFNDKSVGELAKKRNNEVLTMTKKLLAPSVAKASPA